MVIVVSSFYVITTPLHIASLTMLPSNTERVDFRLENDSTMIISGPSKSGKTSLVVELLRRKGSIFRHPIRNVYWFHGAAQGQVHDMLSHELGVVMKHGIPSQEDLESLERYDLLVLDDLQNEMKQDAHITSLFLKQSHHKHYFVIVLQQNIYGDKEQRFRNANVHYWLALNNPRNQRQVGDFLSRMYPSSGKKAIHAIFNQILSTEGNYGYLFVDFTPNMRSDLRLRSHILTSPMYIYKVNDQGGFSEWLALSTLDEAQGSNMKYDSMVLLPKARYQALVGGANRNQVKALLEPKKAFVEEAAKQVIDYQIAPDTVNDYYSKLLQFDKLRRDFFLPRKQEEKPLSQALPSSTPQATLLSSQPSTTLVVSQSMPKKKPISPSLKKQKRQRTEQLLLPPAPMKKPRLKLRDENHPFQRYGQFLH